jgi:hypothetical protein
MSDRCYECDVCGKAVEEDDPDAVVDKDGVIGDAFVCGQCVRAAADNLPEDDEE